LLDDPHRRQADGLPGARQARAAAHLLPAPADEPERRVQVVRAWTAVGESRAGARGAARAEAASRAPRPRLASGRRARRSEGPIQAAQEDAWQARPDRQAAAPRVIASPE